MCSIPVNIVLKYPCESVNFIDESATVGHVSSYSFIFTSIPSIPSIHSIPWLMFRL